MKSFLSASSRDTPQQDIAHDFERLSVLRHPLAPPQRRIPPLALHQDLRTFWTQYLKKKPPHFGHLFDALRYWVLHGSASLHYPQLLTFSSNPFFLICSLLEQGARLHTKPQLLSPNQYGLLPRPLVLGIYHAQPFPWHSELLDDPQFCHFFSLALQHWHQKYPTLHHKMPAPNLCTTIEPLLRWMFQMCCHLPVSILWQSHTPFHLLFAEPLFINQPKTTSYTPWELKFQQMSSSFALTYPMHSTHRYFLYQQALWLTPPPHAPLEASPWHLEHHQSTPNRPIHTLSCASLQGMNFAQHFAHQTLQCLDLNDAFVFLQDATNLPILL